MILTDATNRWQNTALLWLRVTFGAIMIYYHGWGKLTDPDSWEGLGSNMHLFGIDFAPKFWGFMIAFAESICAGLILIGIFTRPAAFIMMLGMIVAVNVHLNSPEPKDESHAIKVLAVAVFFVLAGAGRYSVDARLGR